MSSTTPFLGQKIYIYCKIIEKSLEVNKTDTYNSGHLRASRIGGVERYFFLLLNLCLSVHNGGIMGKSPFLYLSRFLKLKKNFK